jgi:tetratricopeptide (TPR) repeat protein
MKRIASLFLILCLTTLTILLSGCSDPAKKKQVFLNSGNRAYDKGDYKSAALYYRRAIGEDSKFSEGYYRLGLAYLKSGMLGEAANQLQRAFTLDSSNADAGAKLAEIYILALTQEPKRAKAFLPEIQDVINQLMKKDPKSFDGLRLSAFMAVQEQKVDKALELYKAANDVKPNQADVIMPWATVLMQDHQEKEGEQMVLDLIKKRKDFAPPYDLLYSLYARDHRVDDAERILKAKADAMPDHPEYRIQLAGHYFVNQRREDMDQQLAAVSKTGKDGQGHILVGDFLFNLREYDSAQKEFEAGVREGGKNKAALELRLVNLFSAQNKFSDASKLINEVVRDNPKDSEALATRASLQVNSGEVAQIQAALADLKGLVQRNPDNFRMHYELARAYIAQAQKTNKVEPVDLARVELETTVKLRPDFAMAKLILAQLSLNKHDYGKAIVMAEEILSPNPSNVQALLIRASAWTGQKEYDKARASLESILKASPSQQDARYQLGEVYRAQGSYAQAEATFREFRRISPGDPRSWIGILQTMQDARRYKDAEVFLLDEVANDPKKEGARMRLGGVYVLDKQYDKAIEQFNILLKNHPDSSDLHAAIGDTLRLKGDMQASIDYFRKAVSLNPSAPAPMVALAMVLEEFDQVAEARGLYEKILKIEPNNFIALNNLAFIKAEEGSDIDGALTLAQKAKQEAPKVDTISDTLGWIYIKKNLSDEAIRIFTDLVRKDPDLAMYRYHLAQAYSQKGDKLRARQECETALGRIKANPANVKYEKRLRDLMQKVA